MIAFTFFTARAIKCNLFSLFFGFFGLLCSNGGKVAMSEDIEAKKIQDPLNEKLIGLKRSFRGVFILTKVKFCWKPVRFYCFLLFCVNQTFATMAQAVEVKNCLFPHGSNMRRLSLNGAKSFGRWGSLFDASVCLVSGSSDSPNSNTSAWTKWGDFCNFCPILEETMISCCPSNLVMQMRSLPPSSTYASMTFFNFPSSWTWLVSILMLLSDWAMLSRKSSLNWMNKFWYSWFTFPFLVDVASD